MRMWMVNPKVLCRRHLLGEHVETHMFVGSMNRGIRVDRYVSDNLLEFNSLHKRHDMLAREMTERGYRHSSPLPALMSCTQVSKEQRAVKVDRRASLADLISRCEHCAERFNLYIGV